nr:hypothetical protein [Dendronalium sp. ChiSLP03b]
MNFQTLRDIGIKHLQDLSGKLWTDYNLHDPGVTILEVLSYAVTDLGYRNNLDIKDLLALNPSDSNSQENNFFTLDEVLTCNPVTELDLCKRLIDIPGVRNAKLEKVTTYKPDIYVNFATSSLQYTPPDVQPEDKALCLHPRGLYTVCIDLDPEYSKNACGQIYRSWSDVLDDVKSVLCRYRNLCEDVRDVVIFGEEEIALCTDIELAADADAEDVLVNIYVQVQAFLSPHLRFYTLQELLDKGKSPAEIFAGRPSTLHDEPYASHGFIDTDELAALTPPPILHTSDLYQEILKVPGVAAIRKLSIINYINGLPQSQHPWYLQLTEKHRPVLGVKYSKVNLFKGNLPIGVNGEEVQRRYNEQQAARIKTPRDKHELDLPVPQGSYYNLADHYSIQHDFPLTYGISEEGLPETASALRKAQARQLKGYLVFFDQLLANYLARLAHVRDLFSWEIDAVEGEQGYAMRSPERQYTYFTEGLNFPGWEEILGNKEYLTSIGEDVDNPTRETYRERRNRFLDHLLARFAESFTDYVLLNYRIFETHQDKVKHETETLQDKARFLQDYPALSRDRFRAFNYCNCEEVWDTDNVSGFKKRVSRLLGIDDVRRRDLCHYRVKHDAGSFTFAVNCGLEDRLKSQHYSTQKEAEAALEKFLLFALHADFYKRLSYRYFYHYGWKVVDASKSVLVNYNRYFPSQAERLAALPVLLQELSVRLAQTTAIAPSAVSFENFISIELDGEDLYYFRLEIPPISPATGEMITFTGVQRYFSRIATQEAAIASLQQIRQQQNYRQSRLGDDDIAKRFTYYGYALIDNEGQVLSDAGRWLKTEEREIALKRWFSSIQANQNQFKLDVETTGKNYCFVIKNNTDNQTLLRSLNSYSTVDAAWQAAGDFAENLRYLNRYVSPARDPAGQSHGLGIKDKDGNLLAVAETDRNPREIFQQLNSVEQFLRIENENQPIATSYSYRLLNRNGDIVLQSIQVFENENTARDRFYCDVLGILFEPGAIYPTATNDGFGFRVLSKPGDRKSEVAIHPHTYTSEQERDAAVNGLFLLVRTARLSISIEQQSPAFIGQVCDQEKHIILEGTQRHDTEDAAWKESNFLVELAQEQDNFRLVDSDNGVYGWELTNESKDQILASHYYSSLDERNQAIAALQARNNDEGFHVLEHILLRPKTKQPAAISDDFLPIIVTADDAKTQAGQSCLTWQDPYSFWVTVILPYWPERFRDINFRRFVEQTLRLEAPAHVALKIAWLDVRQMREFEAAYRQWLEQLSLEICEDAACDLTGALNRLLAILPKLRSVYPKGILLDSQESGSKENPIILNQTALGTAND